jgi:hypothetical protein
VRSRDAWLKKKENGGTGSLAKILVGMCAGDQEACAVERITCINTLKIITEIRK